MDLDLWMDLNSVIITFILGGIILVITYILALRRGRRAEEQRERQEQEEQEEQRKQREQEQQRKQREQEQQRKQREQEQQRKQREQWEQEERRERQEQEEQWKQQEQREQVDGPQQKLDSDPPRARQEPITRVSGEESSDILSQRVHAFKNHPVLLRRYVSSQAYGKGRALLEALGLSTAQIRKYYGMYPLNEEESVQEGILAWIGKHLNSTWRDVLKAMETADIAIQERKRLEEELCAGGAHVMDEETKTRTSPTAGSDATFDRSISSIIPDIKAEYVKVKGVFVKVCETQGTPTLKEVKEHCFDLIEGVFENIPQTMFSHHEDDIKQAESLPELARVVCFRLSTWISYDFFKNVVAEFQPALKTVEERLMHYEDQLKPLLQQKLLNIAELQQREKDTYEVPKNMAEFAVKYGLDEDGLQVTDLIAKKDFLAQRLGIPKHLLQVLSWKKGSVVITYRILRDVLPLAELALYREDTRGELTQHDVKEVYLDNRPSQQPNLVDQSPQTVHSQRRAIVTVLDAHRQDLDVTSLTSGLKEMGILTAGQCRKLASLDNKARRHEALMYTLLAHDGPDTYDKLVEYTGLRDASIAAGLRDTFNDVRKMPGALSVMSSSPGLVKPIRDWKKLGECQKVILHNPEGGWYSAVAVNSEGLLAVTDSKCVHLLKNDGSLVRSIGEGVLSYNLSGVAFDLKGNVWVTDASNNLVFKLSQKGQLLQTIRYAGSENDHFNYPCGMCVSPEGLIYVCDWGNHRVTVYDEKGKFLFMFGSQGNGPGCFDNCRDVTCGSDGLMYVTDARNGRVRAWTKRGIFMRQFQTKYLPACIAATSDNHLVITSFTSHTVMVYTLRGQLVQELIWKSFYHREV